MALAKKGTRKIEVHGESFRWLIRRKPTYDEASGDSNLLATVELLNSPASVLTVVFDCRRNDNWLEETKYEVTPAHISEAISRAISEGWSPEQNGMNHQIEIKIT